MLVKRPQGNISVFQTTGTDDKARAEVILAQITSRALKETLFGKIATATFDEAAVSYIESGGEAQFIRSTTVSGEERGIAPHFKGRLLRTITQADLDRVAKAMLPAAHFTTRNRQAYTPFIAIWNHAVRLQWAEPRKWTRPRKPKGHGGHATHAAGRNRAGRL